MSRFVQLHLLTNYPPSNLNRDDTGRPKTALMGDALRLRVSSQSQKRAWRTSDEFAAALVGHLGTRTKLLGKVVFETLVKAGVPDQSAREWAQKMAACFAPSKDKSDKPNEEDSETSEVKPKSSKKVAKNDELTIPQLAHISPEELDAVDELTRACAARNSEPTKKELDLLRQPHRGVDIAMFGRMLAGAPTFNVEAAVQVAHAVTVHKAAVEDDYFTAVDDLNQGLENKGAGHVGERSFGAGLFYLYVCIDRELLRSNLDSDAELTGRALEALTHAMTKVSPTGMQNSHASRAYATYVLAEKGCQQPRSLVQAFLKPIKPFGDQGMLEMAVKALVKRCENFDKVYGACADDRYAYDVEAGEGTQAELVAFVRS